MPTTYTHYAFGQDILHRLPKEIQSIILPYEDYYSIGVHGPDILFYYRSFFKNRINQYGVKVHNEPMKTFLKHAFTIFPKQPHKKASFAWLAGFMTHYILDSTCHPYIRRRMAETGISHAEIERDWDSLMMQKDHLNPYSHLAAGHIRTSPGYGHVIAPFFHMTPVQIRTSLFYMRLILNHVFRSSFGLTSHMTALANSFFLRRMNYQHYFVRKNINPNNIDTLKELDRLYQDCQAECTEMITKLYQALKTRDTDYYNMERFKRCFA